MPTKTTLAKLEVQGVIQDLKGIVLHGTRSGILQPIDAEYNSTLRYVNSGANHLGWNVTIGHWTYSEHIDPSLWGWHCREESQHYNGVEFAQAQLGDPISDGQIEAFVAWYQGTFKRSFPAFRANSLTLVNHSDLDPGIRDGKTDVEPRGIHSVRKRILERLEVYGIG